MNFFEHQEQARRQSRWLIVMFALAVVAIVVVIDLILLVALGAGNQATGEPPQTVAGLLRGNIPLLTGGAAATLAVIGLASLFKTVSLRSGGGQVARSLGATLVEPDTRDLLRRRLRNVVEEIALASGVSVPEVYVLEQESGINAFAAGYAPADAAVAVTRGALEKLSRNELQGVIAHEFSHILNGDMRINIRLMGALFGILLLALIGRRILIHSHFVGRSRDRNGAALLLIAFGLTAVGYIGLFFGRWIKAAVSRQREYLADASAVQFTRDPDGVGGALKKIAVYSDASYLQADSEEIGHMLFGSGRKAFLFATHPPLNDRIRRIDPGFRPEDLDQLAARIQREQLREQEEAADDTETPASARGPFDARRIIEGIGQAEGQQVLAAAVLLAGIPMELTRAARSVNWAPEVLFYLLLDADDRRREQQLLIVASNMGADSEARVRALAAAGDHPVAEQRLPLLEMALPALKRRPAGFVARVLEVVEAMAAVDQRTDVFEYLTARLIAQFVAEAADPAAVHLAGSQVLQSRRDDALSVLSILVQGGHDTTSGADAAFWAGVEQLGFSSDVPRPAADDWVRTLDSALPRLDALKPRHKENLVRALAAAALHDGEVRPAERELLRAVCGLLHVPLPLLSS